MFTVCPKCALTLVVTAADLRVAQGYVRCGRCSNVFNALARLSEDRQAAVAAQPPPSPPEAVTQSPTPKPSASPPQRTDSSGTFRTGETAVRKMEQPQPPSEPKRYDDDSIPEEDLEFNPDATDLNKVFVEQAPSPQFTAATGTFKAIRLEAEASGRDVDEFAKNGEQEDRADERFDTTDTQLDVDIDPDLIATMTQLTTKEHGSSTPEAGQRPSAPNTTVAPRFPQPDSTPQSVTSRPPAASKPSSAIQQQHASAFETTQAIRAALAPRRRTAASDTASSSAEQPTPWYSRTWTTGSIALLVLLLLQILHHYRHDLATSPTLNGPLTAIYAALGMPLVPRWDLNDYEVRQLGASAAPDSPGQITVRASVKNGAHQAQPLPLLRVTLQDRFGNRIASRDVPPQSYLPRAIPGTSMLSAGQRIDADMTFVDPGSNAVGFEIDACMPAPEGGIVCASDATR